MVTRRVRAVWCMTLLVGFVLGFVAGLQRVDAQTEVDGYLIESSGGVALVTEAGRWVVQPMNCALSPGLSVRDGGAYLELSNGTICQLAARYFVDPTPCANHDGVCDASMEPRG